MAQRGRPPKMNNQNGTSQLNTGNTHTPERKKIEPRALGRQSKLAYEPKTGMQMHWINDSQNRLEMAKQSGWTHVLEDGKPKMRIVDGGRGTKSYLMQIPTDLYYMIRDQIEEPAKAYDKSIRKEVNDLNTSMQGVQMSRTYGQHISYQDVGGNSTTNTTINNE